jgi:hypothetical protein
MQPEQRFCTSCGTDNAPVAVAASAATAHQQTPTPAAADQWWSSSTTVAQPPSMPAPSLAPPTIPAAEPGAPVAPNAPKPLPASGSRFPKRTVIVALVVVVAFGVIGFSVLGGNDNTQSGRWLGAVSADPTDSKKTLNVDGVFGPSVLVGDNLLLTNQQGDSFMSELVAISLATGREAWHRDAQSLTTIGSRIFIINDGRLIRLDAQGKQVGTDASINVSDGSFGGLGTVGDRLMLFEDDGVSVVDPGSLKVLARDISPSSCSSDGAYCLRQDFDSTNNEMDISVVRISTGKSTGSRFTVTGSSQAFATTGGKAVVVESGDLEVYSQAGKQLSRSTVGDEARLAGLAGNAAVVADSSGRLSMYSIDGDITELDGRGPAGFLTPTSQKNTVLVSGSDNEVNICTVGADGFDCQGRLKGFFAWPVQGMFYLQDTHNVAAYRLSNTDTELWSMRVSDNQSFTALDGKVALTEVDFTRSTTTIDVYG